MCLEVKGESELDIIKLGFISPFNLSVIYHILISSISLGLPLDTTKLSVHFDSISSIIPFHSSPYNNHKEKKKKARSIQDGKAGEVTNDKEFDKVLISMFPNSSTGITVYVLAIIAILLFGRIQSTEHSCSPEYRTE